MSISNEFGYIFGLNSLYKHHYINTRCEYSFTKYLKLEGRYLEASFMWLPSLNLTIASHGDV
jgi:hypothetical protein